MYIKDSSITGVCVDICHTQLEFYVNHQFCQKMYWKFIWLSHSSFKYSLFPYMSQITPIHGMLALVTRGYKVVIKKIVKFISYQLIALVLYCFISSQNTNCFNTKDARWIIFSKIFLIINYYNIYNIKLGFLLI